MELFEYCICLISDTAAEEGSAEEDLVLVEMFQSGKRIGFDRIAVKYQKTVYNICYRFLNDYDNASDAAQESFVKIYKGLNSFQMKSSLNTWIYRVTLNTCKNFVAKKHYKQQRKNRSIDTSAFDEKKSFDIKDDRQTPMQSAENNEMKNVVLRCINKLSERKRSLIILRDLEEKSYEEIAGILKMQNGTVKSAINRARLDLKKLLMEEPGFET